MYFRNVEDTPVPYVLAAKKQDYHVLVIPTDIAESDTASLNGNGFNIVKFLGEYEIWSDYTQE